ncbi:MAG: alpha-2-macroglobulin [candidate division NC10 bacterium]|nr:alpha-2-macroglobulin [candidate division NC10 bacterium]
MWQTVGNDASHPRRGARPLRSWPGLLLAIACLLPALAGHAAESAGGTRILQFTPQGTVKRVRQVTVRFSEPMVPLGDPRGAAAPFEIECPEKGTARWVDSRNWAYDFARDLPAGIRCTFRVAAGLTSVAGRALGGQTTFVFSTGGPAIKTSLPSEGNDVPIDEEQAFLLVLDAEPTEESLLRHVHFTAEGIRERIGARLIAGAARDAVVKSRYRQEPKQPVIVLQAQRPFPNSAKVSLVWGKGVTSRTGIATDQDQTLWFKTRGPFTAELSCERVNKNAGCVPVTPIRLSFSALVSWEQVRRIAILGPGGRRFAPAQEKEKPLAVAQAVFRGPFPESTDFQVELPPGIADDAGRPLSNAARFPLAFKTDPFPPLAKFSARFGVVEWKADPALPVTLRNLEREVKSRLLRVDEEPQAGIQSLFARVKARLFRIPPEKSKEILPWLRRVATATRDRSFLVLAGDQQRVKEQALPKPQGEKAFEVVGIPLEAPGLYLVELESPRLGAALLGGPRPMFVPAAALVTNLAVHFKWGREASLAWVTTLDTGRPVPGAKVAVQNCRGDILWSGETDHQGLARIEGLPGEDGVAHCENYQPDGHDWSQLGALASLNRGVLVTAQTPDDFSFAHSSWTRGIEPWRFRVGGMWDAEEGYFYDRDPRLLHTILDRSLFRAGETVHMKHLLRRQTLRGFAAVAPPDRPSQVWMQHQGSDQKYALALAWDASGIAESTWKIPREAKLGTYHIIVEWPGRGQRTSVSARFRVEEFRLAMMKGTVKLPAEPQIAATELPVDLSLRYLAGGVARDLPVTLRSQIRPRPAPPLDLFEGFTFANGPVPEGIRTQPADEWGEFFEEGDEEVTEVPRLPTVRPAIHQRVDLILDAGGSARARVTQLPRVTTPQELFAEMEFRDPNGEARTVSATVPLWPAHWLVGIEPESWLASRERLKAWVAVIDIARKPVAGARVRVDAFERLQYSNRKRMVGGFYAYEHIEDVRPLGAICQGATDARGRFLCEGKPAADGNLILQASVTDPAGNPTAAHVDVWVPDSQRWWFDVQDHDRMDILPERRRYEPGETARLQVRMPFAEATALVTVEREGVLEASIVSLSGTEPVVEVPIKGEYAPNVFVSVLAVRGRVKSPQPTALVDLAKPAFKLGVAELRVGWRAHELKVTVTPERDVYRVRETARVKIAVRNAAGQPPPPASEIALAAVDEGLLELLPNRSWNLLERMMQRRQHGVSTATAQMQVVGKRHYGLKALPQGGGGGRDVTRELFDTLLLWKVRVPLDARGEAVVAVPLNDSLTSFRIVAVATGGVQLFGTGAAAIRSTQEIMILAGIPPLVREGDLFPAEFTLRNTTARPMEVSARGRLEGLPRTLEAQRASLAPGEAKTVQWQIGVPAGLGTLRYAVEVTEAGGGSDSLRVVQQVRPAVPVRTFQATLFQWERPAAQPVERPGDALPGRGGIQIALASTLTDGLAGVRDFMRKYPYGCLEQQVSVAVALREEERWRGIAAGLPSYLDGDGLLKYFPRAWEGSPVLTAYVMSVIHEAGWTLPPDIANRMTQGLTRFVQGRVNRRSELPTADLSIRKLAALEALSRHGKATPDLLGTVTIEPNLWPTSAVLDWWSLLHRVREIPQREARLKEAEQIVQARLNLQGTTMGFSTERADFLWWLMVSPDVNAVRLILHLLDAGLWKEDLPRLLRAALGRQRRGAWDLTVANAWGALAVEKFSRAFEQTPVFGVTSAALAGTIRRQEWAKEPKGATLSLPWPPRQEDLQVSHEGSGNPWITVQAQAAIPLTTPLSTGFSITKELAPIEQRRPGKWSRGDILRVRLTVEAQSDMTWLVVDDPIPAGASHLGTRLGGDSALSVQGEQREGYAWESFAERAFESFRAYYRFVPKGTFSLEYTIRLNHSGTLQLPTTRVEALYSPEMLGELPNAVMEIVP